MIKKSHPPSPYIFNSTSLFFQTSSIILNYITFPYPAFRPLYFKHTVIAIILNYISNKSQNIDLEPQISTARYVFARPGGEINSFTDVLGLNR